MSALSIIQNTAARLALPVPSVIFSSTDTQIIQMRTLMNQVGLELMQAGDWIELQTEWNFSTVASAIQTSAIPVDFDHMINATMWDRTSDRPVYGPLNAVEWQREKAGPTFTSVYYAFRMRGEDMLITPTPASGLTIYYEYISNLWCESSGGTGQTTMLADTDVSRIEEELLTLGTLWRWRAAHKLDYAEEKATFDAEVAQALGRSGGAPVLNLSYTMPYRRYQPNIPEGNWP